MNSYWTSFEIKFAHIVLTFQLLQLIYKQAQNLALNQNIVIDHAYITEVDEFKAFYYMA